ncbi:MAG: tripartite tricarboxylate transporter permease [Armatimonadota bacterium]|nr:tripartite tricarboxylate transporter permease [Armatimonadota bacterium]MDR7463405.1 tripartite tricarboxylate transporter permease [Armatimonadota bacterium]MDR7470224.1 tripartite tricarboxylate transporter permease [Armatimonadota bacterium]MDR7475576.1 tripartite tricarboxylate transporter permease [Armatimonadota bacterium]MDR7539762.1 tripartite tricarboxylate transporter permease [Armatimonadota bacterium]
MDAVLKGLAFVLQPGTLLWIVVGDIVGVFIGALPGLTATMGLALFLPITIRLDSLTGIALMLGLYFGAVTGASIPAILFGIPGNPNAIATVLDGLPMARKGQAGVALGGAVIASLIGGLVSTTALLIASPALARFSLFFGPAEYFALAVASLTIIASVSGTSLLKGLVMGAVGVLLSTVGIDTMTGAKRFMFGNPFLANGIGLVPVLIGMFGITQALEDAARPGGVGEMITQRLGRLFPRLAQLARMWRIILESSWIGTLVGILPGAGASVAVMLAYERARQLSERPAEFGSGRLEGVIAPEVANNACIGGGLIPTLTLALPGESAAVPILAALVIHGITPGPLLFSFQPHFIYAVVFTMIVANVTTCVFQLGGIRLFVKALSVPPAMLTPLIIVLSVLGAYALNGWIFDAGVAVAAGVGGFFLKRAGYPLIPLILGLVLGGMLESEFRRAMIITGGDLTIFVTRPLAALLLAVGAISLVRQLAAQRRLAAGHGR